jgi:hypothetical protein
MGTIKVKRSLFFWNFFWTLASLNNSQVNEFFMRLEKVSNLTENAEIKRHFFGIFLKKSRPLCHLMLGFL